VSTQVENAFEKKKKDTDLQNLSFFVFYAPAIPVSFLIPFFSSVIS